MHNNQRIDIEVMINAIESQISKSSNKEIIELLLDIKEKLLLLLDNIDPTKIKNFIAYVTIVDNSTRDMCRKLSKETNVALDLVAEIQNRIMSMKLRIINMLADTIAANYHKHLE